MLTVPQEYHTYSAASERRTDLVVRLDPLSWPTNINAHGTGTHMNDACETAAIHAVFGAHAKEMTVVSTKSMTGHLLGGAGGIEAVFTALALRDQFAPPTIHYAQPDPECDLDYVPNTGRQQEMQYALSNSLGFGGHNACIALRRWEG